MTQQPLASNSAPALNASAAPQRPAQKTPKRIARTILNALKGGVVPRIGLPYIAVGRKAEIDALLGDVEIVAEGGAAFRFIVGKYGSGKSFLMQTIRSYVMDKGFAVADADLSPERRLQGSKGQGLATYRELMQNLATKTMPEGGALPLILDRWIGRIRTEAAAAGAAPESPAFASEVRRRIYEAVGSLSEVVHGFEFAKLLVRYADADAAGDDAEKAKILRWFRGEYTLKSEAKAELGTSLIVTDDTWYDFVKVLARFLKGAGYAGLILFIDELVNLYKIPQSISRNYNYEKILTMYNDTLQGKARWLGIIMGGTPQCVEDQRRGLYSYEALKSRLADGRFSREGLRDLYSPVIHLEPLTIEELLVLVGKLAQMHADLYGAPNRLSDADLAEFLRIEFARVGADSHITPREIIRDFIELLNLLVQHPDLTLASLMSSQDFQYAKPDGNPEAEAAAGGSDDFAEFDL